MRVCPSHFHDQTNHFHLYVNAAEYVNKAEDLCRWERFGLWFHLRAVWSTGPDTKGFDGARASESMCKEGWRMRKWCCVVNRNGIKMAMVMVAVSTIISFAQGKKRINLSLLEFSMHKKTTNSLEMLSSSFVAPYQANVSKIIQCLPFFIPLTHVWLMQPHIMRSQWKWTKLTVSNI